MNVVIAVPPSPRKQLNVKQLFNPLFFAIDRHHPDMKRQRSRRLRSLTLQRQRELKQRRVTYVQPLPETHRFTWMEAVLEKRRTRASY